MKQLALSAQVRLLHRCIEEGQELSATLERLGYGYDSLRYRHNSQKVPSPAHYTTPEDYDFPEHGIPAVSFYSGCGGLDLGFEAAGFDHLAAFESNPTYCQTLRRNRPSWRVFGPPFHRGDLRDREEIASLLRNEVGIRTPFEGVFHGGPPCQPFSVAANQRFARWGENFKRIGFAHNDFGTLLFDFLWYIGEFRPRAFLMENVPGLATVDKGEQLSRALIILQDELGYDTPGPILLDAQYYGVPQRRQRLFIFGWHSPKTFTPYPEDLLLVPCYKAFEGPLSGIANHITRKHKAASVIRYMELNYGERDHLGRVDRLDPNRPSKTVIAGGTGGGGRSHLHPDIARTLSPRECARLQTFPDSYIFCGAPARQFTQIGNAVPPLLALKLARALYESIFE